MSPALVMGAVISTGRLSSPASRGGSPARIAAHTVPTPTATFISTSGSFRASSVGPRTHMNGAVTYADSIRTYDSPY